MNPVAAERGLDAPLGFTVCDRATWAALGRDERRAGTAVRHASPVTVDEWESVYEPLAWLIGAHLDARDGLRQRLAGAGLAKLPGSPFVIGLAGGVSAGKSTCATALASLLRARPGAPTVDVLSTDGFLVPNAELAPRGLVMRKGFPETYDWDLVGRVLGGLAAGEPVDVPQYSHDVYDVVGSRRVAPPQVLILEGINALAAGIADFCAVRLYLDADEPDLRSWYVTRFLTHIEEARADQSSFFSQWVGLGAEEARRLAVAVWEQVNLVNLVEHILPSRWRADVVLHKGADHAVTQVALRNR